MRRSCFPAVVAAVLASAAGAQQSFHVVPSAQQTLDGGSRFWVAGTIEPRRQQTLIDASLLTPLLGRRITGLQFRRNVEPIAFAGGTATLTVRLSHSPRTWLTASERYADNQGQDLSTVFQGTVTLPNSPAPSGPAVPWAPDQVLAITFQTPFDYQGGTLALDVGGSPTASNTATWWPADAVWQPASGTVQTAGAGCGPYGGPQGEWSFLTATNLVPGGSASFQALGAPGELAIWLLAGAVQLQAVDLTPYGGPGCFAHVAFPLGSVVTLFGAPLFPARPAVGGMAAVELQLPASAAFLGAGFASQWFAFGSAGLTSSNAHQWALSGQYSSLPITLVTAPALGGEPMTGKVLPACGHVLRFEYQ